MLDQSPVAAGSTPGQALQNSVSLAKLVDRLGFRGVTIPEHHLINILLIPDPLQFAVKVASITEHLEIVTSVCQLPLHDMRIFAGQVIQADILCEGRLVLGRGRSSGGIAEARSQGDHHSHPAAEAGDKGLPAS